VNPGGGSGWDEAPLDIQVPDDARELDRDVLAYRRELRAQRRRNRLRRLTSPFSGPGTVMPLLASILAVCLVAGAMLSVATFSPSTAPADHTTRPATTTGAASPAPPRSHATAGSGPASGASTGGASTGGASTGGASPSGTGSARTSTGASPSGGRASRSARASVSPSRTSDHASPSGSRLSGLLRVDRAHRASPLLAPRVNSGRRDRYDFLLRRVVNRGGRKVTRWNRRLLLGAMAVLVPALAGCEAGLNAPTLEYHPANFTANKIQDGISFSNLFVLDNATNGEGVAGGRAGVFLSLYAKNGDRLTKISAPGTASSVKIAGGSVNLPSRDPVNMGGPVPKVVLTGLTNPLQAGAAVTMKFTFAKAGTITIAVPVEPKAFEYATFSPPASPNPAPSAKPKPTKTAAVPGASGTASNSVGGATGSATATASASNSAGP
jgi:hypothetical protein